MNLHNVPLVNRSSMFNRLLLFLFRIWWSRSMGPHLVLTPSCTAQSCSSSQSSGLSAACQGSTLPGQRQVWWLPTNNSSALASPFWSWDRCSERPKKLTGILIYLWHVDFCPRHFNIWHFYVCHFRLWHFKLHFTRRQIVKLMSIDFYL